jgi:hypothetical protein
MSLDHTQAVWDKMNTAGKKGRLSRNSVGHILSRLRSLRQGVPYRPSNDVEIARLARSRPSNRPRCTTKLSKRGSCARSIREGFTAKEPVTLSRHKLTVEGAASLGSRPGYDVGRVQEEAPQGACPIGQRSTPKGFQVTGPNGTKPLGINSWTINNAMP